MSENLQWPGIDGIPVRGAPRNLYEHEQVKYNHVADFQCRTFHLNDAEQAATYKTIMDAAARGVFKIWFVTRDTANLDAVKVYLEWYQRYVEYDDDSASTTQRLYRAI